MQTGALYYGDCLEVMSEWPSRSVDLIYLDPPFNSKADYNMLFSAGKSGKSEPDLAQLTAFTDTWEWNEDAQQRVERICSAVSHPAHRSITAFSMLYPNGNALLSYLSYMAQRLAEMHRLLKDDGSIYLHCDPTASHYLKLIMDDVFGAGNFRNEITWKRYRGKRSGAKKKFPAVIDVIQFYSKSNSMKFALPFTPLDPDYVARVYTRDDGDGKGRYRYGGRIRDRNII